MKSSIMSSLTVSRRPHQTDDWAMVIVHRKAAPPLRFMGRALLCEEAQDMYVRAWEAKAGGVVLAHALPENGGKTGMRHTTAEGAMTALEDHTAACLVPRGLPGPGPGGTGPPASGRPI